MSKYKAKKTAVDGITFDSKKEAHRYLVLKAMQEAGEIDHLQMQVKYELIPPCKRISKGTERGINYIADFVYTENGNIVVEDVKGVKTDVYKIKKKLMLWRWGIEVRET